MDLHNRFQGHKVIRATPFDWKLYFADEMLLFEA